MHARRAFTILELVLALLLSSIAIGTVVGMYSLLNAANRNEAARFMEAAEQSLSYEILQRTFSDLVAATPILPDDSATDEAGPSGTLRGGGGAGVIQPSVRAGSPVMFDLSWVEGPQDTVVQRLEVVTLDAPAAVRLLSDEELWFEPSDRQREQWASPDRVRSVFEFVRDGERWDLVWRPTSPPGSPVPIVRDVVFAQWSVLERSTGSSASQARTSEGWKDVSAAFLGQDFPIAVRLEFETAGGRTGDWLFETLVVTRSY